ncbi:MAG: hypothetical protein GXO27_02705 [Chlorobi bacterium]|nr:hypothetical protein [Chlorobiota bacterium]
MIRVKEVSGRRDLKSFIDLPYKLYKNDPHWIPPLKKAEWDFWTRHPGLKKNIVKLFLAKKNFKTVGRLALIINRAYNELHGTRTARFFAFEAVDDAKVIDKLFARAEEEARKLGMDKIHGPLGFNNLDHQGMQVEGFQWPQTLVSVYNFPYYPKHLERMGYTKEIDWVEHRVRLTDNAIKRGDTGAKIIGKRFGIKAWQPRNKAQFEAVADDIFRLYNEAYSRLPYMVPLDEEDIVFYKESYMKVLLPQWAFFARTSEGQIVGFLLAMPSLGDALRKAKGKLFPFGFYHIWKALRKPKEIDVAIIGSKPEYENKGAAVVVFDAFHKQMLKHGIHTFETGGVFETNLPVLTNWKNYDAVQHKRKRVYGKAL